MFEKKINILRHSGIFFGLFLPSYTTDNRKYLREYVHVFVLVAHQV